MWHFLEKFLCHFRPKSHLTRAYRERSMNTFLFARPYHAMACDYFSRPRRAALTQARWSRTEWHNSLRRAMRERRSWSAESHEIESAYASETFPGTKRRRVAPAVV